MLIVQLKRHFPARWPEWFMSGLTFMWGSYVALHPQLFTHEATAETLRGMAAMCNGYPPSAVWGVAGVTMGLVRAAALFVNGAYTRTPMIRLTMSFLSAFIWTQVFIGLLKTGIPNVGWVTYAGLVVMDIVSAYRAATDTVFAERARHHLKQGRTSGGRSSIA